MSKIAFIGLGNMGAPMALNLVKGGHEVVVFDLVTSAMEPVVSVGARAAKSAADAAAGAQVVISMLPASPHVEALYLGDDGLLARIDAGSLVIDCSTIAPDSARKVAKAALARGLDMVDAPVSGGTGGAVAGTLTFIVGGEVAVFERARPILEQMGKNIFHAGSAGAGQVAKIANNMMLGIQMAGAAEALSLGVANGLDPKVLSEIITKSSGRNWAFELYNPWPGVMESAPAARGYAGGFGVDLMLKDLGLAAEAAMGTRSAVPLGELARNLYALHSAQGNGKLDFSSIVNLIRKA